MGPEYTGVHRYDPRNGAAGWNYRAACQPDGALLLAFYANDVYCVTPDFAVRSSLPFYTCARVPRAPHIRIHTHSRTNAHARTHTAHTHTHNTHHACTHANTQHKQATSAHAHPHTHTHAHTRARTHTHDTHVHARTGARHWRLQLLGVLRHLRQVHAHGLMPHICANRRPVA
jgi:hypothetical protein